ncbi:3-keto-disaccharide hydrolase [Gaetbulibacter aestuarii]|uniref:DUF1080 domain-containing protein n=1 Tax=Gaetbulibacter aestuarii TaxID=1502358 RepID=A0ABW7N3Z2_9FLAO
MKQLTTIGLSLVLLLGLSCKQSDKKSSESGSETPIENQAPEKWTSIFNGKDLDGWHVKIKGHELDDNYKNTFRVEDGVMKVSYDQYDEFHNAFGHIFYEAPFSNYKFRLQYRFVGEQAKGGEAWGYKNSGIMLHCQSPESMLVDQNFPVSLEFQLLGGLKEDEQRPTGNLCTPGTNVIMDNELITEHCINSAADTYYDNQWITAEVIVSNDTITHYINGKPVITYSHPTYGGQYLDGASEAIQAKDGQHLTSGYISLQSESHPIEFKNIEIQQLD